MDKTPVPPVGGWTIDTVLQHVLALVSAEATRVDQLFQARDAAVDRLFISQREAVNLALTAADRAVTKAEIASEKRFEGVNEFRAQLGDQQRTLMPRAEAESRINELNAKVGVLERFRTEQLGKGVGSKEGWGMAVGFVALVLTVLMIVSVALIILSRVRVP